MHKLKLGHLVKGDIVKINDGVFITMDDINLYAEAKKFLWSYPGRNWNEFTVNLISLGYIEEVEEYSKLTIEETFNISHLSPNIFALESLLLHYNNVMHWLNGIEVGLVGTWMNMPRFYEDMKDLFISAEAGELDESGFRLKFDEFINTVKDLK